MEKRSILDCPVSFDKASFFELLSLSALRCIASQNTMGELVIGDSGWNVDLKGCAISFGESSFRCGILGSESESSGTWLWGWAHTESGLPEISSAPSRRAKKALSAEEFTAEKFLLDDMRSGHNIAMICCGAADKNVCYYRCPYDGGAVFVQIEGLPEEVFAPLDAHGFVRNYMDIVRGLDCDHRLLAAGALWQNGTPFTEENGAISADFGGSVLELSFEDVGGVCRVTNISGQL